MRALSFVAFIGFMEIAAASYPAAQTVSASRIPDGYTSKPDVAGFGIVLVLADTSPSAPRQTDESVPPGAAKALADIQNLLSFKSYRLLDSQYTAGSNNAVVRLRGPEGKSYALAMQTGQIMPGRVVISNFKLRELGQEMKENLSSNTGDPTSTAVRSEQARDGEIIMDTTFSMNIGETVVVGTSRLAGGSALVVILTAKSRQ